MTKTIKSIEVLCDECKRNCTTVSSENVAGLDTYLASRGWLVGFNRSGDLEDICPQCLEKRKTQCGRATKKGYWWPGQKSPVWACEEHFAWAQKVAENMGFHLGIETSTIEHACMAQVTTKDDKK